MTLGGGGLGRGTIGGGTAELSPHEKKVLTVRRWRPACLALRRSAGTPEHRAQETRVQVTQAERTPGGESAGAPRCPLAQSRPALCHPMHGRLPGSSVHGGSPGKNTGVGCHSLLQGIFPTQGSSRGFLHCRWILYRLSHQGRHLWEHPYRAGGKKRFLVHFQNMILTPAPAHVASPSANPASADTDHPPLLLRQAPNGSPCLLQGFFFLSRKVIFSMDRVSPLLKLFNDCALSINPTQAVLLPVSAAAMVEVNLFCHRTLAPTPGMLSPCFLPGLVPFYPPGFSLNFLKKPPGYFRSQQHINFLHGTHHPA